MLDQTNSHLGYKLAELVLNVCVFFAPWGWVVLVDVLLAYMSCTTVTIPYIAIIKIDLKENVLLTITPKHI